MDFRARRVAFGVLGRQTALTAQTVLQSHGFVFPNVSISNPESSTTRLSMMQDGLLDAWIVAEPTRALAEAPTTLNLRPISLDPVAVDLIRSRYPFYTRVVIPKGTYPSQAAEVETIGINSMFVCRNELPNKVVYELTKSFFESLPELRRIQPAVELIDPELASATSIPLHPGAARFYREQQLRR